jgi:hypothetical protein
MQSNPWIKVVTLVFFFGAMISFVAFRSGVFSGSPKTAGVTIGSSVPDSPSVAKPGSEHMIYSTKSGKIIEPSKEQTSTPQIMPSSKSMIMVEPTSTTKQSAPVMTDSVKQTRVKQKPAQKKTVRQKAKSQNKANNNANVNTIMPSSKSGPVLPAHQ